MKICHNQLPGRENTCRGRWERDYIFGVEPVPFNKRLSVYKIINHSPFSLYKFLERDCSRKNSLTRRGPELSNSSRGSFIFFQGGGSGSVIFLIKSKPKTHLRPSHSEVSSFATSPCPVLIFGRLTSPISALAGLSWLTGINEHTGLPLNVTARSGGMKFD